MVAFARRTGAVVLVALSLGACGSAGTPRAAGGGTQGRGVPRVTAAPVTTADRVADAGAGAGASENVGGAGDGGFASPGARSREVAEAFNTGNEAFARGDLATAARAFERVYALDARPEMAFNLARVYDRMGEVAGAVRHYEIALAAATNGDQQAFIRGRIDGLRAYEHRRREGIAQAPASADELSQEGVRWFQNGIRFYGRRQYRQALIAFEQAANHLQSPELYFNLAMTHERLGHIDQAIEFLNEFLSSRRGTAEERDIRAHIERLEQRRR